MRQRSIIIAAIVLTSLAGCATLGGLQTLQPPRFAAAADRPSELRLLLPGPARPLGGAALRVYAHVENPNPVGVTIRTLAGSLFVDEQHAAVVDLPLGLPLLAARDTIIPLDLLISFADVPNLATTLLRAVDRNEAGYRLDASVTVDAGILGQPAFGPMTLLQGTVPIRR